MQLIAKVLIGLHYTVQKTEISIETKQKMAQVFIG